MAADILKGESPSALSRKIPNYNTKEKKTTTVNSNNKKIKNTKRRDLLTHML